MFYFYPATQIFYNPFPRSCMGLNIILSPIETVTRVVPRVVPNYIVLYSAI